MPQILEVHPGAEGEAVWNRVWKSDQYSNPIQRMRRAQKRYKIAKKNFKPLKAKTVLDLGCGGGEFLKILSDEHSDLILKGLDSSEIAISRARTLLGEGVELTCGSALQLPVTDDSVDQIFSFGLLEHISDVTKALSEIRRVMRPGAHALISLSCMFSFQQIYNSVRLGFGSYPYGYQRNYSFDSFKRELPPGLVIKTAQYVHADSDQLHVLVPDYLVSKLIGKWSRYLFVELEMERMSC